MKLTKGAVQIDIYNRDCMDYMRDQPSKAFDLAICDPPYFNGPQKLGFYGANVSSVGVVRAGYQAIGDWRPPTEKYFTELRRVSRNQIIWGINYFNMKNLGPGRIIWDKCNGRSTFSDAEIAYCSMHDSVRMFRYMWNGFMQGKGIVNGQTQEGNKKLNEKRIHPTQKPVKLYDWLLLNYAKPGQRILDTHGGSMSSAIAAHNFGCDMVLCEKDAHYFEAGCDRFREETRQRNLFEGECP
jgi:site-specific DNA-methyltransferase (adenine-specific)